MREIRREMQIVFQDPYASLNPRMTVREIIVAEPLSGRRSKGERRERVGDLLERRRAEPGARQPLPPRVLRRPAPAHRDRPRPRAQPAAARPRRAGVRPRRLHPGAGRQPAEELQDELGLAYLFIAHDLSVVRHISDRVAVMYLGHIVEIGTREQIFQRPTHPYTQALLSAVPIPDPSRRGQARAHRPAGRRPEPVEPAVGLPLPHALLEGRRPLRRAEVPPLEPHGYDHPSACHYAEPEQVLL
jgi:oligopeptide transport system ATP-binding protein